MFTQIGSTVRQSRTVSDGILRQLAKRHVSHSKICIVGGGTAGVSTAAQLVKEGMAEGNEITVFDPSPLHWYQPGFTMVAGGVLGDTDSDIRQIEGKILHRPMKEMFSPSVKLIEDKITSFEPDSNSVYTSKGDQYTYDYLIVCNGNELRYDMIDGALDALNDESSNVGSMYRFDYAKKMNNIRNNFKGGVAICTQPPMPIKCAGAPQKFLYLAEYGWRKNNVRNDIDLHFYTSLAGMFGVKKYDTALKKIVESKHITPHYNMQLVKVENDKNVAYFKDITPNNTNNTELLKVKYDLLHIVPPQSCNQFVKNSKLADGAGYVDINQETLQSTKYDNVFSIGDTSNAATSKTAAAVFAQTPIMLHNLNLVMGGHKRENLNAKYDGYTSCPIFVGDGKLLLAEFLYGGVPSETFPIDQSNPQRAFYYLKRYGFPYCYWNLSPKAFWYGRKGCLKPRWSFPHLHDNENEQVQKRAKKAN